MNDNVNDNDNYLFNDNDNYLFNDNDNYLFNDNDNVNDNYFLTITITTF